MRTRDAIVWDSDRVVTAALVRTLKRLDREGKLADPHVTSARLRKILGCTHGKGPDPCGPCLGSTDAAEAREIAEHKAKLATKRRRGAWSDK